MPVVEDVERRVVQQRLDVGGQFRCSLADVDADALAVSDGDRLALSDALAEVDGEKLDDSDALPVTTRYSLLARAEPGVMPRVLELFAKRGLVPHLWHSTATGAALAIDVHMTGLDRDLADYIGRCMRQIVGVETVLASETRLSD